MRITIRQTRQEKGMSLQQFADLMGVDKLEALSLEMDDSAGIIEPEALTKAHAILSDETIVLEPLDLDEGALSGSVWTLSVEGRLENEHVKQELRERIEAGQL